MLSAFGGVGKTALVKHWLNRLELAHYRHAERVYGWSFSSQGAAEDRQASGDAFLGHALRWFGDRYPARGSPWEKGARLAELILQKRTLLVLDGLEPLQVPSRESLGRLRDEGVGVLLKQLARAGMDWGLCVVTTRLPAPELVEMKATSVQDWRLDNLSMEAGGEILRHLGVTRSTRLERERVAQELKGHALALTLLGKYLAVVHDGDIGKRDLLVPFNVERSDGTHAWRIMRAYDDWLSGKAELDVLYILGLFDRPADAGAVSSLREPPPIPRLTERLVASRAGPHDLQAAPHLDGSRSRFDDNADWNYAVRHLRELQLLFPRDDACPGTLDCHPLVREYFAGALRNRDMAAWQAGHERLYKYYSNLPEQESPDTLAEMEPLFRAVSHGCWAGKHEEALHSIYWNRIVRQQHFLKNRHLGAAPAFLACLSSFFEDPWDKPSPKLTNESLPLLLKETGHYLFVLGRLNEALGVLKTAMKYATSQNDYYSAADMGRLLREVCLVQGDLIGAQRFGERSMQLAVATNSRNRIVLDGSAFAQVLNYAGRKEEARELFKRLEETERGASTEATWFRSFAGFWFCEFLVDELESDVRAHLGKRQSFQFQRIAEITRAIEARSRSITEDAEAHRPGGDTNVRRIDLALGMIISARVQLLEGTLRSSPSYTDVSCVLNKAIDHLRHTGLQHHLTYGLLARSQSHRSGAAYDKAWRDLDEVREISDRCGMGLYLAEYHIEAARLFHAVGQALSQSKNMHAVEAFLKSAIGDAMTNSPEQHGESRSNPDAVRAKADSHLAIAKQMVEKMGYGRRKPDVVEMEQMFSLS